MKNGLRLIVIVLKTAVAAYLIGCVGLSWLQQLRQKLERFGRMQPKEHRNDQTESETRRPIRVIRRYGGHLPEPFVAEAPGRWHGNRTGPIGAQTEKFHLHAVRRLYLAVVNRAILDVLENGQESREAKRWLLSRDFDSLQAAVD